MGHKLYNRIDITKAWVEGGKICPERSPEVVAFRSELAAKGKRLPNGTRLCIHAQRTGESIEATTQGTVTDCIS